MTFFNEKIDIHHVFPQDWCKKAGIKPGVFNSIVNKTPLSKKSNIMIGGDAPSVYLKRIQDKQGLSSEKLDAILRTHLIDPKLLRDDDFNGFFKARMKVLADIVGEAMGKPVVQGEGSTNRNRTSIDLRKSKRTKRSMRRPPDGQETHRRRGARHDAAKRQNIPTAEFESVMRRGGQERRCSSLMSGATAISIRSSSGAARTSRTGPT